MNDDNNTPQTVNPLWGTIAAAGLFAVAAAFGWLLVQGIRRGELFTISKRGGGDLVTLAHSPAVYWINVAVYVFVIVLIVRMAGSVLKSARKDDPSI